MPPGSPAVSMTGHRVVKSEASSSVFITVGAQCPIRNRFPTLRRRSVAVEVSARSSLGMAYHLPFVEAFVDFGGTTIIKSMEPDGHGVQGPFRTDVNGSRSRSR